MTLITLSSLTVATLSMACGPQDAELSGTLVDATEGSGESTEALQAGCLPTGWQPRVPGGTYHYVVAGGVGVFSGPYSTRRIAVEPTQEQVSLLQSCATNGFLRVYSPRYGSVWVYETGLFIFLH